MQTASGANIFSGFHHYTAGTGISAVGKKVKLCANIEFIPLLRTRDRDSNLRAVRHAVNGTLEVLAILISQLSGIEHMSLINGQRSSTVV